MTTYHIQSEDKMIDTQRVENASKTNTETIDVEDSLKHTPGDASNYTPEEEREALRKLDWSLIPL
jgi:hypothetical protein